MAILNLRQVSVNLIDNAIKYNKEGGVFGSMRLLKDGTACISVNDTGSAFPAIISIGFLSVFIVLIKVAPGTRAAPDWAYRL